MFYMPLAVLFFFSKITNNTFSTLKNVFKNTFFWPYVILSSHFPPLILMFQRKVILIG